MKKLISLLLCFTMIFGSLAVSAYAEEDVLSLTVANDLHLDLEMTAQAVKRNNISEDFAHIASRGQLGSESIAIIRAFLEKACQDESDYILINGDLTAHGTEDENRAVAEIFEEYEIKYGKKIIVNIGNHDVLETSVEAFKEIYHKFGPDEAVDADSDSASYTYDLNGDYRLICIDTTDPGGHLHGVTQQRIDWVKAQGEKARAEGKKLIAAVHHPVLEHYVMASRIYPGSVVTDKELDFAEVLAQLGIKYVFAGHTHDHDIAKYTAADETVMYEVVTSTLNSYPCLYRYVTVTDDSFTFETRQVDSIDLSYLPDGISENALRLAADDFTEYTKQGVWTGFAVLLNDCTTAEGLKILLKIEDEEMIEIVDKIGAKLNEALNMPFEKADETEEGKSIESIVAKYKTVIPDTDYKNLIDLATAIYQTHVTGDENITAYSDEALLFTRGVAAALSYTLEDVTAEEYALVLSYISELLGMKLSVSYLVYAGDAIKRFEGLEIFVTTALLPVFTAYGTDSGVADNNVVLPGYNMLREEKAPLSLLETLTAVLETVFYILRTLFSLLPIKL